MPFGIHKSRIPFIECLSFESKAHLLELMIGSTTHISDEVRSIWTVMNDKNTIKREKLSAAGKASAAKRWEGHTPKHTTPKRAKKEPSIESAIKPSEGTLPNDNSNVIGSAPFHVEIKLEDFSFEDIANLAKYELTEMSVVTIPHDYEPNIIPDEETVNRVLTEHASETAANIIRNINPYFYEFPDLYLYDFNDGWKYAPKYNSKKDGVLEFMRMRQENITTEVKDLLKRIVDEFVSGSEFEVD